MFASDDELDRLLTEIQRIKKEEVPEGISMTRWAVSWPLKHPAVTSVLAGVRNPEQLRDNCRAAELVNSGHPLNAEKGL